MNSVFCSKEKYEEERSINWQTAYKRILTPRLLLQLLGTECGRNIIHPNIWVNSLISEYKSINNRGQKPKDDIFTFPNWIITDMRFPNELEAIKNRGGISIRVFRNIDDIDKDRNPRVYTEPEHPSETA